MKVCFIYHSYSGITRKVAGEVRAACGGDAIEVVPRPRYTPLTAYTLGCVRARNGTCDPIDPEVIDVSGYDLLVIGTPVWAFRATPAVNAAVAALQGAEGKRAVVFATCGGSPGETIPRLREALAGKGTRVVGEMVFMRKDTEDAEKVAALSRMVMNAAGES
ncbi:MAG: ArsR family transcriptional regulator [Methanolinea sp.]|nr:ArsR family transcriptional regulator [Methanolinea sp.]